MGTLYIDLYVPIIACLSWPEMRQNVSRVNKLSHRLFMARYIKDKGKRCIIFKCDKDRPEPPSWIRRGDIIEDAGIGSFLWTGMMRLYMRESELMARTLKIPIDEFPLTTHYVPFGPSGCILFNRSNNNYVGLYQIVFHRNDRRQDLYIHCFTSKIDKLSRFMIAFSPGINLLSSTIYDTSYDAFDAVWIDRMPNWWPSARTGLFASMTADNTLMTLGSHSLHSHDLEVDRVVEMPVPQI